MITRLDPRMLADRGQAVSVGLVDSGFSWMPPYAVLHGLNPVPSHRHGNRVLSVFAAPDSSYPLSGLSLHLACFLQKDGYVGLMRALDSLPHVDILSISLSWEDDRRDVKDALLAKANMIFAPHTSGDSHPYPAAYKGIVTCSCVEEKSATYCIRPVGAWSGHSYAVPAMARIAAHYGAYDIRDSSEADAVPVGELFSPAVSMRPAVQEPAGRKALVCEKCGRTLMNRDCTLMAEKPSRCPYCGLPL